MASQRRKENALAKNDDPLNMDSSLRQSRDRSNSYNQIEEDVEGENRIPVFVEEETRGVS